MAPDRREFIRGVGATLAAMLTGGCASCYAPLPPTPTAAMTPTCYAPSTAVPISFATDEQWQALRACWLDLADAARSATAGNDPYQDLLQRHDAALAALVVDRKLQQDIADQIRIAFDGAVSYQSSGTLEVTPVPVIFDVQRDLAAQAAALAEMAQLSDLDPDTVVRARDALERDMASLARLRATPSADATAEAELPEPAPTYAEIEAARILVALLAGER